MNRFSLKSIVLISILFIYASPKKNNPEIWFDTQYTDAIQYCIDHKELINTSLSDCCLPSSMAISVAFPEMLRYSLWRDLFETTALELLYVNGGKQVADFSIGWLQMKPSFAETLEFNIQHDTELKDKYQTIYKYANSDSISIRRERICRLKEIEWQLNYLSAFIDFSFRQFKSKNIPDEQMLKYLAGAYNRGMNTDINELADFSNTKTFPYGPGRENPFGFVEVAEYFFHVNAQQLFNNQ